MCDKVGYASAGEAWHQLRYVQARRRKRRGRSKSGAVEKGVYRCPDCARYHLTSQKRR